MALPKDRVFATETCQNYLNRYSNILREYNNILDKILPLETLKESIQHNIRQFRVELSLTSDANQQSFIRQQLHGEERILSNTINEIEALKPELSFLELDLEKELEDFDNAQCQSIFPRPSLPRPRL